MGTIFTLLYRIRHSEKDSKLPHVAQLVSGRGWVQTQVCTSTDPENKCCFREMS